MNEREREETAEEHWQWLESLLHKIYVDAMVHGMKHGEEAQDGG
uniref:Uncharacterized protein n=1 Tax=viral metagenome TaxID=1070528 RepID=A0A6M3KXL8_9ZZZZ